MFSICRKSDNQCSQILGALLSKKDSLIGWENSTEQPCLVRKHTWYTANVTLQEAEGLKLFTAVPAGINLFQGEK